ncbi:hypothetical protein EYF80_008537 [Liparis tanakae]|uniref:Uncharacterized protein n=1 Tax=Liparis tanakae TaxID=230148 RepID=A0A4Z2IVF1_9TELE|nr:hypothetical protein EYF80_008537 [Liparis tanakae]
MGGSSSVEARPELEMLIRSLSFYSGHPPYCAINTSTAHIHALLILFRISLVHSMLVVMLLLPLSILVEVSIAAGEAGVGELWLSDLAPEGGSELQATPEESLVAAGLSGGSACERISSWTISLSPTL